MNCNPLSTPPPFQARTKKDAKQVAAAATLEKLLGPGGLRPSDLLPVPKPPLGGPAGRGKPGQIERPGVSGGDGCGGAATRGVAACGRGCCGCGEGRDAMDATRRMRAPREPGVKQWSTSHVARHTPTPTQRRLTCSSGV